MGFPNPKTLSFRSLCEEKETKDESVNRGFHYLTFTRLTYKSSFLVHLLPLSPTPLPPIYLQKFY